MATRRRDSTAPRHIQKARAGRTLNNLGVLKQQQGYLVQAGRLHERALYIREHTWSCASRRGDLAAQPGRVA
jgi:hypothetical protein